MIGRSILIIKAISVILQVKLFFLVEKLGVGRILENFMGGSRWGFQEHPSWNVKFQGFSHTSFYWSSHPLYSPYVFIQA